MVVGGVVGGVGVGVGVDDEEVVDVGTVGVDVGIVASVKGG